MSNLGCCELNIYMGNVDLDEFEVQQSSEQAPPSPDYVPGLEYPEYVTASDDEIPINPLPADASPTTLSPGYVVDSDLEEDPKEDPADYPADGGDDDDPEEESSEDDDDDDEEKEASEEEEDKEHLAPADSVALPVIDLVPSAKETEPFETDESDATPPPPQIIVPISMTRLHWALITIRPHTLTSPSAEALIAEYDSAPTPLSQLPSLLSLLSSLFPRIPSPLLHTSPTYIDVPLGYRAAMI
nr:hypothetical protein [Tanacetum cinerariifolium]